MGKRIGPVKIKNYGIEFKLRNRFTLRGRAKVGTQWQLYCLVHNIEKLAHNGYR